MSHAQNLGNRHRNGTRLLLPYDHLWTCHGPVWYASRYTITSSKHSPIQQSCLRKFITSSSQLYNRVLDRASRNIIAMIGSAWQHYVFVCSVRKNNKQENRLIFKNA